MRNNIPQIENLDNEVYKLWMSRPRTFQLKLSNRQYQIEPKLNPNWWLNKPQMDFSKSVKETDCSGLFWVFYKVYNLENSLKSPPKMHEMAFQRLWILNVSGRAWPSYPVRRSTLKKLPPGLLQQWWLNNIVATLLSGWTTLLTTLSMLATTTLSKPVNML